MILNRWSNSWIVWNIETSRCYLLGRALECRWIQQHKSSLCSFTSLQVCWGDGRQSNIRKGLILVLPIFCCDWRNFTVTCFGLTKFIVTNLWFLEWKKLISYDYASRSSLCVLFVQLTLWLRIGTTCLMTCSHAFLLELLTKCEVLIVLCMMCLQNRLVPSNGNEKKKKNSTAHWKNRFYALTLSFCFCVCGRS